MSTTTSTRVVTCETISFEVTQNGNEKPSGAVIVMFSIAFIIILVGTAYVILYSIGHALTLDFDILDAALNYGAFFAIVGLSILQKAYLGNGAIDTFLEWAIDIGVWTNLILPTIYFIITLMSLYIVKRRVPGTLP